MPRKTQPTKQSVGPTVSTHRAMELLRQQLGRCEAIEELRSGDPEVTKWETTTVNILHGAFGKPDGDLHSNTYLFANCDSGEPMYAGMSDEEIQWHHELVTKRRKALLESFIEQLELLAPETDAKVDENIDTRKTVVDLAVLICSRLHLVANQLQHRRQNRPTLEINDEYDVQDLLHGLLRLHFDDIRPEEWTPSYGGRGSRMDFLLKEEKIVTEVKMARANHAAKEISDELIIDAARYKAHPNCKTLVCLVYDPNNEIKNPRGVERDLSKLSGDDLQVLCIITP